MSAPGHQLFADELARFAAESAEPRLTPIAQRIVAPLSVAVRGRRGVGCSTVARALRRAGLSVTAPPAIAEVVVYVTAEVVKPEDRAAVAAASEPVLIVANKADLTRTAAEPLAATRTRGAPFPHVIGVPTQNLVALLAVAALDELLDDTLWAALRLVADQPADMRSPDDFVAGAHPAPTAVRQRLLDILDLYGIELVVGALQRETPAALIGELLRRVSGIEAVVETISALAVEARYRRVLAAVGELETLAVTDDRLSDFLCSDETVIARMAAAVDVIEATGCNVDPCDEPAAHLQRAVHWQRYSRSRMPALHRRCGADVARGSLRLWSRAGGAALMSQVGGAA